MRTLRSISESVTHLAFPRNYRRSPRDDGLSNLHFRMRKNFWEKTINHHNRDALSIKLRRLILMEFSWNWPSSWCCWKDATLRQSFVPLEDPGTKQMVANKISQLHNHSLINHQTVFGSFCKQNRRKKKKTRGTSRNNLQVVVKQTQKPLALCIFTLKKNFIRSLRS